MKLYYAPRTRSSRPRWLLEELGVDYELARIDLLKKEHKNSDYLKIHPLGQVPAFEDGTLKLFESAAICLYLADQYPEKNLAPKVGTAERGLYYQWMMYVMATVEPPLFSVFLNEVMLSEEKRSQSAAEEARKKLIPILQLLNQELTEKTYILGEHFSAADVLIGATMIWADSMKIIQDQPAIEAYMTRMRARPAYQRATKD